MHTAQKLDLGLCCGLAFGWSEKALVDYDALVWRDQVADLLKEIVKEPKILVGNSLGGFTALVAAEAMQQKVVGIALLNSAGQFGSPYDATTSEAEISHKATEGSFSACSSWFLILASQATSSC